MPTSLIKPEGKSSKDLIFFFRNAKVADRKIWLAGLTASERQTVMSLIELIAENPWSQYMTDPAGFIEQGLGETIWSKQREILESVRDNKRTAVPACHAPGKSHLAARIVAWWAMCQPVGTSQIVTTATSFRQVRNILWSHIRKLHATHNLAGECLTVEWKMDKSVVAFGFAPAQYNETALQGIHAPNLLVVVDEAGGISDTIGNALEALMTGGNTRLLLLGNPPTDQENSWFERACNSDLYNTIPISAYDTPNYTGEAVGNCTTCPKSVPTHSVATHLVDQTWVNDVISELGENSSFVTARVKAEFPKGAGNRVIPSTWIEEASNNLNPAHDTRIRLGIDIAADGGDEFVIARADGYTVRIIHASSGADNANAVQVANICLRYIQEAEADALQQANTRTHTHTDESLTAQGNPELPVNESTLHKRYYGRTESEHLFAPQTLTPQGFPTTTQLSTPPQTLTQQGFQSINRGVGGRIDHSKWGAGPQTVSVKVDAIGLGWGVVGLLEAWGREGLHGAKVVGVNVAERAFDAGKFKNQRAEMWWNGRVLVQPDVDGFQVVRLDVDRKVLGQLGSPDFVSDSSGRIQVVGKGELRKKGAGSPDRAEAVLLALYEPKGWLVPELVSPLALTQRNQWRM